MKTTYVVTIEHKAELPADMIDLIGGRIYTMQALDQSARSVVMQRPSEWLTDLIMIVAEHDL
jgi:hypothetical protein